jgi:hypothetical protein
MRLRLLFIPLFLFLATTLFAQSADTTKEKRDRIFIRVEINPSFKGGNKALNKYLDETVKTAGAHNREKGMVYFIVSPEGDISEVKVVYGDLSFEESLVNALSKSSGKWNSALQNEHHVNAYCKLKVTFRKNRILTEIE